LQIAWVAEAVKVRDTTQIAWVLDKLVVLAVNIKLADGGLFAFQGACFEVQAWEICASISARRQMSARLFASFVLAAIFS
jgi:hypothetical protein